MLACVRVQRKLRLDGKPSCPAHEDKVASLSISAGKKGVLVYCHAGCTPLDIVNKLNLKLSDLFYGSSQPTPDDIYTYTDSEGRPVIQVVRKSGKRFRQKDAQSGKWTVKDIEKYPYRVAEFTEHSRVIIVEGEKDADRLWSLGIPATTLIGGAGKWLPEYKQYFAELAVIILPDNDEAGFKHAAVITENIQDIVDSCRTIILPGLPPKGDVSDWLNSGHSKKALEHILSGSKDRPLQSYAKAPPSREINWLIKYWIPRKTITLLAGSPKVGKSALALHIAALVSTGGVFGVSGKQSHPVEQGSVYLWSGEDMHLETIKPRLEVAGADLSKIYFSDHAEETELGMIPFHPSIHMQEIFRSLPKDCRLVIIDPIIRIAAQAKNQYSANEIRDALEPLVRKAETHDIAILGITHFRKKSGSGSLNVESVLDRVRDSAAWTETARMILAAGKTDQVEGGKALMRAGSNIGPSHGGFVYNIDLEIPPSLNLTEHPKITFIDVLEGDAEDQFSGKSSISNQDEQNSKASAMETILLYIDNSADGLHWPTIQPDLIAEGYSKATLRRARDELKQQSKIRLLYLENVHRWVRGC